MHHNQELISPELARKIAEYERVMQNWKSTRGSQRRGSVYALLLAMILLPLSYLASAETGPINQATWFTAFTFFSFIGGLVCSIAFVVLSGILVTSSRPMKDFTVE